MSTWPRDGTPAADADYANLSTARGISEEEAKRLLDANRPDLFAPARGRNNGHKLPLAQGEIGYGPHFLDTTHVVDPADRDGAFVP